MATNTQRVRRGEVLRKADVSDQDRQLSRQFALKLSKSGAQTPPHDLDTGREADASWSATFRAQGIGANNQVINFVFVIELKKKPPNN